MTATIKLKPGKKGTKKLVSKHGDSLLCVRYRYDAQSNTCFKTVELIIERRPWKPSIVKFDKRAHVPVRIGYSDKDLREKAKATQGKWDPKTRLWYIQFGKIKGTELEKLIVT